MPRPSACRQLAPSAPAQVNEQLAGERGSLAQVLRQEFADRLAASEEENRQVKAELAALRARQQLELEQLTREKQAELEEVHGRWVPGRGPRGAWWRPRLFSNQQPRPLGALRVRVQVAPPPRHLAPGPPAWLEQVLCRRGGGPTRATVRGRHTPGTPPSVLPGHLSVLRPTRHRHLEGSPG